MNKTWLILKREYLIRVKKKSFIVTTLLVPLFFAALMFVPMWLATRDDKQERIIAVYDESTLFYDQLGQEGFTKYHFIEQEKFNALKSDLNDEEFYAVLYIPGNIYTVNKAELLSKKQVPIDLAEQIERKLSQVIETDKRRKVIEESQMPDLEQKLAGTKTKVSVSTLKVTETGEQKKSSSMVAFFASYLMGFIIYFFVFMYGSMVMRSVMEEKKNRIVEVIVSSVKPYQLMAGKIVGTALVGLTQVAIWIVIGVAVMGVVQNFLSPETAQQVGQSVMESQQQMGQAPAAMATEGNQMAEIMENIANLNIPLIIFGFVFYFLLGYLLYSSLLGAVGAAVDNDEDVQQMIFPITFPLILAIIMLVAISRNPEGSLAF